MVVLVSGNIRDGFEKELNLYPKRKSSKSDMTNTAMINNLGPTFVLRKRITVNTKAVNNGIAKLRSAIREVSRLSIAGNLSFENNVYISTAKIVANTKSAAKKLFLRDFSEIKFEKPIDARTARKKSRSMAILDGCIVEISGNLVKKYFDTGFGKATKRINISDVSKNIVCLVNFVRAKIARVKGIIPIKKANSR